MNTKDLIAEENHEVINNVSAIIKQDMKIQIAVDALKELLHVRMVEFDGFNESFGVTSELMEKVRVIKVKLEEAKYGGF